MQTSNRFNDEALSTGFPELHQGVQKSLWARISRDPPDLSGNEYDQMKAPGFSGGRHSGKYISRRAEELIHASGAAGIKEKPELFLRRRPSMSQAHRASVIQPAVPNRKQERLQPGNWTSWLHGNAAAHQLKR
jgi:hypothetical protein